MARVLTLAKLETVQEVCSIIAASCSAADTPASEPSSASTLFSEPPTFVRSRLHPSHCLDHERGTFICPKCGFIAVSKASELTDPVARRPLTILTKFLCDGLRGILQKGHGLAIGLKVQFLFSGLIRRPVCN